MRVLYIAHSANKDGSTMALLNMIRELRNQGVEIGVTVPFTDGYLYDALCDMGVSIFYRRGYHSIMSYATKGKRWWQKIRWVYEYSRILVGVQRDIYAIIKEFRPDVVHTNSSAVDYALLGCFLTGTPHVWHIRELLVEGCGVDVFPGLRFLKWKMRLPFSHNIAVTKALYDYYRMSAKDTVVYDGVFDRCKKIDKSEDFSFPYFMIVGHVSKIKGTQSLVEQFVKFAKDNKEVRLLIVGGFHEMDSYYLSCVEPIRKNKLEDRVMFLGNRDDVYELMASAKAVFSCSEFEGFGFTPVEAMFCNTLVIGRNVGGVKEQFDIGLQQTGKEIALRYTNDDELPDIMLRVVTEDFTEMKKLAKGVVMNNYTTQKNANEILAFYNQILSKDLSQKRHFYY